MQQKLDRRIERTQQLLTEALVSLILEKGYEAVTIKDITERANVAYVTFFRRYKDIDELLVNMLEAVVEEISALMDEMSPEFMEGAAAKGTLIFKHAAENSRLYRILLSSPGAAKIVKRTRDAIAANIVSHCDPLMNTDIPIEIAAHHNAAALLALIEWWLEHEMPYPPERMGEIYETLLVRATWQAVQGNLLAAEA
jgi:AcrR family transcriptional regulator